MKLELYRNLWGVPGPVRPALARVAAAGYHGIEAVLFSDSQAAALRRALRLETGLVFKGVAWPRGRTVRDQLASLRREVRRLLRLAPGSLSVIGGYDCWSDDDAARYFEGALRLEEQVGLPLAHETHRNSVLFHPAPTRRILARFPELKLVCDFSHWVVACERLIDDQLDLVRQCGRQAVHLHARVGSEQSPQVSDVRAPEFARYRRAFEQWWDIVWTEQERRGLAVSSLCPEFGPPPYLQTAPYSGRPAADLWAVCEWQKKRQQARFARRRSRRGMI